MAARHYDLVKPNYEALKEDLKRFGLTADSLSRSIGKSAFYVSGLFNRETADRKTIERIEERMFRPHGSYYTEIEESAPAREDGYTRKDGRTRQDHQGSERDEP